MKTLHINVADKVATYLQRDGDIVCGNSDYEVKFTFDAEWAGYEEKTARFIWNGQHTDVPFTGDTCPVPEIRNARLVTVGVYVEDMSTTTPATIPARLSILCKATEPHPEYVEQLAPEALAKAEEALGTANRAEETADLALETASESKETIILAMETASEAQSTADRAEEKADELTEKATAHNYRIGAIESHLGLPSVLNRATIPMSRAMSENRLISDYVSTDKRYAKIGRIYGRYFDYNNYDCYNSAVSNPPRNITLSGTKFSQILFGNVADKYPQFGASDRDYITFDAGKAFLVIGSRWDAYDEYSYQLAPGEVVIDSCYDHGTLIALAKPTVIDVSDLVTLSGGGTVAERGFDGFIDLTLHTTVSVNPKYSESRVQEMTQEAFDSGDASGNGYNYRLGGLELMYE